MKIDGEEYVSAHNDPLIELKSKDREFEVKWTKVDFAIKTLSKTIDELKSEFQILTLLHENMISLSEHSLADVEWYVNKDGEKVIKGKNTKKKFTGITK